MTRQRLPDIDHPTWRDAFLDSSASIMAATPRLSGEGASLAAEAAALFTAAEAATLLTAAAPRLGVELLAPRLGAEPTASCMKPTTPMEWPTKRNERVVSKVMNKLMIMIVVWSVKDLAVALVRRKT